MNDPISDTAVFGRAARQGIDASSAVDLPGQTAIGRVRSLLFDSLRLQAGSGEGLDGWRAEVLSMPLTKPTRRRIRLILRGQLTVVRKGQARVSISCQSRRLSAELICREAQPLPTGALPTRDRSLNLSLVLPRSVRPRTEIRILVFLEATVQSGEAQAEAVVDSIDVEAL
jgi:hypothetical protein